MHLRLAELRAECASQPFLEKLIRACATTRQVSLTRFEWCLRAMVPARDRPRRFPEEKFKELLFAFQALERCGFGRLLSGTQKARARFQWAVMPVVVERSLLHPEQAIKPKELLPAAAKLGITLPPPEPPPGRPGWTRHEVTLRPGAVAELWVPADITPPEAQWLGAYLQRVAAEAPAGDAPPVAAP